MSNAEIQKPTQLVRKSAAILVSPITRSEVIQTPGNDLMSEVDEALAQNNGVVFVFRHTKNADILRLMKHLQMKSDIAKNRLSGGPMSIAHVHPLEHKLADKLGMIIFPVVTPHSVEEALRKGEVPPQRGKGLYNYLHGVRNLLSHGGIAYIPPEGERKDTLKPYYEKPNPVHPDKTQTFRPLGLLLKWLDIYGVDNVKFAFVDFSPVKNKLGPIDLNKLDPLNLEIFPFAKDRLTKGRLFSKQEIMDMADGDYHLVDKKVSYPEMVRTANAGKEAEEKENKPGVKNVSTFTPFGRSLAAGFFSFLVKSELYHDPETKGLNKFEQELLKGNGGIIIYRHYSDADPIVIYDEIITKSKVMMHRELCSAIQTDATYPALAKSLGILGIRLIPVTTNKSTGINSYRKLTTIYSDYESSMDYFFRQLGKGSVMMLAPTAGKAARLEKYRGKSVGRILHQADLQGLDIPFLFVDIKDKGTNGNYNSEKKINPLDKREVTIGRMCMGSDLLSAAGGDWRKVDDEVVLPEMERTQKLKISTRG